MKHAEQHEATPATPAGEILDTIGAGRGRARRWIWRGLIAVAVAAVAAVIVWQTRGDDGPTTRYVATAARRADLRATVEATGTVKAVDQVEVGAEISGTIIRVSADFNDRVEAGQVLCEIDPERNAALVAQARAQLAAAQAELANREASQIEAESALERARAMAAAEILSSAELENAQAAAARAEAATRAAAAQIKLARANLDAAEINLRKTKIRSPIDGVVLYRSVEPGQTVAASLQTPVLFTLARDLTKMELEIDIDEADVSRVREGQKATFTVDAFPERRFAAVVESIHNLSTVVDNVVTYRAVLAVDNADLLLRPGMTATVSIVTAERTDALLIPNAALRFTPPSKIQRNRQVPRFLRIGRQQNARHQRRDAHPTRESVVWVLRAGEPVQISVEIGMTDGDWTEVVGGALEAGDEVLTDVATNGA